MIQMVILVHYNNKGIIDPETVQIFIVLEVRTLKSNNRNSLAPLIPRCRPYCKS